MCLCALETELEKNRHKGEKVFWLKKSPKKHAVFLLISREKIRAPAAFPPLSSSTADCSRIRRWWFLYGLSPTTCLWMGRHRANGYGSGIKGKINGFGDWKFGIGWIRRRIEWINVWAQKKHGSFFHTKVPLFPPPSKQNQKAAAHRSAPLSQNVRWSINLGEKIRQNRITKNAPTIPLFPLSWYKSRKYDVG